jgi:hypothetical protein
MPKTSNKADDAGAKQTAAPKRKPWPDFTKKFGPTVRKAGVTAVPRKKRYAVRTPLS